MRIPELEFNEPTSVILGAGATRGASFVKKLSGSLPPLDADFFTQLQRLSASKPPRLVEDAIEDVASIFGRDHNLTLEQYLTHIEQLANVFDDYRLVGRPPRNPYRRMRGNLIQALAAVLDESIGHSPECAYHEHLVKSLTTRDTIISFNYDWVIDHALRVYGQRKWNPVYGYGVPVYRDAGARFWATQRAGVGPLFPPGTIELLKMHGSMNWFSVPTEMAHIRVRLRQRWWHQQGNLRFEIAPPEWNKPIRAGVYREVWRRARNALRRSRALVFIGYSLPETDLPARALLLVDAVQERYVPLRWLIVVNPDPIAKARIRRTLTPRMTNRTRTLAFDYFEDFHNFMIKGTL